MMRNSLTIARREMAAYFNTPIAYIIIGLVLGQSSATLGFPVVEQHADEAGGYLRRWCKRNHAARCSLRPIKMELSNLPMGRCPPVHESIA